MTLQKDEAVLTAFIFISVICHGMFFSREWIILGGLLILYRLYYLLKRIDFHLLLSRQGVENLDRKLLWTMGLFGLCILFSLAGLWNTVRSADAWLEAWRWLVFLFAYQWGTELRQKPGEKDPLEGRMLLIAMACILLAWFPGIENIWNSPQVSATGRFGGTFGYPNAAAVFFGSLLLRCHQTNKVESIYIWILAISLINTGSRAATLLCLLLSVVLFLKKYQLRRNQGQITQSTDEYKAENGNRCTIGDRKAVFEFYPKTIWGEDGLDIKRHIFWQRFLIFVFMLLLLQQSLIHCQGSWGHLLNWSDTSLPERLLYYWDSLKLSLNGHFLPQAGGWLGFVFIQKTAYWTLNPHSSICQILLNQGLACVILLAAWAIRGLIRYFKDLRHSNDLAILRQKTAVLYLGIHSLIDVDLSFGALGILFWLWAGRLSD